MPVNEAEKSAGPAMRSFASLLNEKVVMLSDAGDYVAIDHHFFQAAMRPLIRRIRLDERWYAETNPDVGRAIAEGAVESARDHYERFGYFEHRLPYPIKVREDWYLGQNPDVREAISRRAFPSGQTHFERCGFREGRFPYPHFALDLIES